MKASFSAKEAELLTVLVVKTRYSFETLGALLVVVDTHQVLPVLIEELRWSFLFGC